MCPCGHLHAWHFFELGSSTSYFIDVSNPQSHQHVFWWPFFSSFLLLTRGFAISLARYRLVIFLILGEHIVSLKRFEWLYADVHWLWGGVRCKILGSINKADTLRITLSVWACLAFHKHATYAQTTSTFDTVSSAYRKEEAGRLRQGWRVMAIRQRAPHLRERWWLRPPSALGGPYAASWKSWIHWCSATPVPTWTQEGKYTNRGRLGASGSVMSNGGDRAPRAVSESLMSVCMRQRSVDWEEGGGTLISPTTTFTDKETEA